jgi:hypothetical protein
LASSELLSLEISTDKETATLIENALTNIGVTNFLVSREPLKIVVMTYPTVMAVLLAMLEDKAALIKGKASLPDGTVYELNEVGMKSMKGRLLSILGSTPSAAGPIAPPQSQTNILDILGELLKNPEATGKLVREVATALRGDPAVALEETRQVSRFTLAIMSLMGLVIFGATVLGYYKVLDGSAVGLVYGTVIGSSFAFLYKYLAAPEETHS